MMRGGCVNCVLMISNHGGVDERYSRSLPLVVHIEILHFSCAIAILPTHHKTRKKQPKASPAHLLFFLKLFFSSLLIHKIFLRLSLSAHLPPFFFYTVPPLATSLLFQHRPTKNNCSLHFSFPLLWSIDLSLHLLSFSHTATAKKKVKNPSHFPFLTILFLLLAFVMYVYVYIYICTNAATAQPR